MIKICKCDDFCEMNLLFPFHSQRTVDREDRELGLPMNLNKHLIIHRTQDVLGFPGGSMVKNPLAVQEMQL